MFCVLCIVIQMKSQFSTVLEISDLIQIYFKIICHKSNRSLDSDVNFDWLECIHNNREPSHSDIFRNRNWRDVIYQILLIYCQEIMERWSWSLENVSREANNQISDQIVLNPYSFQGLGGSIGDIEKM